MTSDLALHLLKKGKGMAKTFAFTTLAAGALLAAGLGASPTRAADPPPPALVVRTLNGATFDLAALRGHVVLVHFWATWCTPCRAEMPALNEFYRRYPEQGVELIGVSADKTRDLGEVRKMLPDISYPVAMASAATKSSFGTQRELPVTYVIDRGGSLRGEMRPDRTPVTEASLEKAVLPLLASP
jgi:cytochrome c biogenesis protein CcmG/thiol:disulfide interchange protein DsbE